MSYFGHTCKLPPMERPVGPCPACDYDRVMANASRPLDDASLSVHPATDRLTKIAKLPANWDSYGALPIDPRAIESARKLITALSHPPQIVPTTEGGIQLEWHRDGIDFDLVIPAHGGTGFFGVEENDS